MPCLRNDTRYLVPGRMHLLAAFEEQQRVTLSPDQKVPPKKYQTRWMFSPELASQKRFFIDRPFHILDFTGRDERKDEEIS